MRKIIKFFRELNLPLTNVIFLVFLNFLISILLLAQPEVLKRATVAINSNNIEELYNVVYLAIIASILFMSISFVKDIFSVIAKNKYEIKISSLLISKLIDTKLRKLQQKQFGDISTTLTRNVENYVASTIQAISELSLGVMSLIITFSYMLIIEWRLAICVLLYNMIIRYFALFVGIKIKTNNLDVTNAMKSSGNYLVSLLTNMITVRIYSNRDFLVKIFRKNENQVMNTNFRSYIWSNGFQDFIWAFSKLAEFIIIYGIGSLLIIKNITNISILLTFVFANDLFTIGINNLSYYLTLRAEAEAFQESLEIISKETDLENGSSNVTIENPFPICFKNVSFSYGDKQILKNADFTICQGEKILLKGANGTGKTTLLKLIAGLYRPDSGEILYGNKDTNNIHISCLANTYGYISQHSNMIDGDVFSNIALTDKIDNNRVNQILSDLNLLHIKKSNPKNLSQGEQQRVNICRVIYKKKPMMIVGDEIFSNIDKDNQNKIIELLDRQYKDITIVLILHENVGIRFDRVLTLSNGKVFEEAHNEEI